MKKYFDPDCAIYVFFSIALIISLVVFFIGEKALTLAPMPAFFYGGGSMREV